MSMFCFQCQETARNEGCTVRGVCGKTPDVANLQDLQLFLLRGISYYAIQMRKVGIEVPVEVGRFIVESLFMTITNANFDRTRFIKRTYEAITLRNSLAAQLGADVVDCLNKDCATWQCDSEDEIEAKAATIGVLRTKNEDIRSLREMLTYGLKGMAAYTEHAFNLGYEDNDIYVFMQEALVATNQDLSIEELTTLVLRCGEYGVKAMALLDKAYRTTINIYG